MLYPQTDPGRMLLGLHIPTLRSLEHEANTEPLLLTWTKKVFRFSLMLKIQMPYTYHNTFLLT